jgi:hypothetical protein
LPRTIVNIAIIALVALVVAFVPGGSNGASAILGVLSLGFLAALGMLGYRLYMENRFTLLSMSDRNRALLYGGITVATMTLIATQRLWNSGLGTLLWFVLLGGSVLSVYQAWVDSRRYGI